MRVFTELRVCSDLYKSVGLETVSGALERSSPVNCVAPISRFMPLILCIFLQHWHLTDALELS